MNRPILLLGVIALALLVAPPASAQTPPTDAEIAVYTGLHAAAARGNPGGIRALLGQRADPNKRDAAGRTPLHVAAFRSQYDALIAAGAPLDHVNNLGWTALIEAVILDDGGPRHTATVKSLVAAGADKTIGDRASVTPLQHAQQRGYTAMVQLLR